MLGLERERSLHRAPPALDRVAGEAEHQVEREPPEPVRARKGDLDLLKVNAATAQRTLDEINYRLRESAIEQSSSQKTAKNKYRQGEDKEGKGDEGLGQS